LTVSDPLDNDDLNPTVYSLRVYLALTVFPAVSISRFQLPGIGRRR
jgi:hypothetical protein